MVRTFTSADGLCIKLGENAQENQALCKQARQNDEWFHVEGIPSPHAILEVGGGAPPRASVQDCAQLVKHYSKYR